MSMILASLAYLSTKMMSGLPASTILSHCTLKSHRTLKSPFCTTRSGICLYRQSSRSSLAFSYIYQVLFPQPLPCFFPILFHHVPDIFPIHVFFPFVSISLFLFLLHSLAPFASFTVTVPLSPKQHFLGIASRIVFFHSDINFAANESSSLFIPWEIYSCSITSWAQLLFTVITFLVIPSMFWSSFFVYLLTPPYRKVSSFHFVSAIQFRIHYQLQCSQLLILKSIIHILLLHSIRFHHCQVLVPLFTHFLNCLTIHMSKTLSRTQLPIIHYCHPALPFFKTNSIPISRQRSSTLDTQLLSSSPWKAPGLLWCCNLLWLF